MGKSLWPGGYHLRLIRKGCANRPFYQIGAIERKKRIGKPAEEVIGSFDPMPNERNEKLIAIDLDRLAFWLGKGAKPSYGVGQLLGIIGYFPIHPRTYHSAWSARLANLSENKTSEEKDSTENES